MAIRKISSDARRKLRAKVLSKFGNGTSAPCAFCGEMLTNDTMTLDHYPIPARAGGHLRIDNVRPACRLCNELDGRALRYSLAERMEFSHA